VIVINNPTVIFTDRRKVKLTDFPIPAPGPGEMLVKTERTQISIGTELAVLMRDDETTGKHWEDYGKFPFSAGYTNVGIVTDVGEDVDSTWIDKRVASYGFHSMYNIVKPSGVYTIPEGIDADDALFFVLSEVAMNGLHRSKFMWGDSAVVYGAGVIGQLTAQYLSLAGAFPVFVADVSDFRLSRLPKRANIIPVNTKEQNINEVILKNNHGRKADIVFELTGNASLIPEQAKLLRQTGKLIILSSPKGSTMFDFHDLCNQPSLKIIGVHNSSHPAHSEEDNQWTTTRDAEMFFSLLESGSVEVSNLITHRIPYLNAVETYDMLMEDRTCALAVHLLW